MLQTVQVTRNLYFQLMVRGIRSVGSSEEETQVIRFLNPLTIISGPNGSGKTTLIEALNYITTGALPSGKLASFVHSVEVGEQFAHGVHHKILDDMGININGNFKLRYF
ncbi:hypothetical protein COOONC_21661 [Cooperia oncophora]